MKYLPARKMGRCCDGFERDAGTVGHILPRDEGQLVAGWGRALCGAKPGLHGNGWADAFEATCPRCVKIWRRILGGLQVQR